MHNSVPLSWQLRNTGSIPGCMSSYLGSIWISCYSDVVDFYPCYLVISPITVAMRSKEFILCLSYPVCRWRPCDGLITRPSSPTVCVKKIKELKKRPGPNKGLWSHWWMKWMNEFSILEVFTDTTYKLSSFTSISITDDKWKRSWRVLSSGIKCQCHIVLWKLTEVSEEHISSIFIAEG
jgi:hypothetical protein